MKSENKYTKRITLDSVPYQGDIQKLQGDIALNRKSVIFL